MSVRFFYVDESYDSNKFCLSAISIRHTDWKDCFDLVKQHRQYLKDTYGVFLRKEIHARDLVRGGGRIAPHTIGKWERSRIFLSMLQLVANLPNVWVFNVCLNKAGFADPQLQAWDRLMNRVERTMRKMEDDEFPLRRGLVRNIHPETEASIIKTIKSRLMIFRSRAVMIADEGREREITTAIRKMHVLNHIPSQFGDWGGGNPTKNIVTQRIVEDPIFKESHRSYFIQLADCVSFALLKREVPPTPNIKKYGIDKMFDQTLPSVCYKPCSPKEPLGIVRK